MENTVTRRGRREKRARGGTRGKGKREWTKTKRGGWEGTNSFENEAARDLARRLIIVLVLNWELDDFPPSPRPFPTV